MGRSRRGAKDKSTYLGACTEIDAASAGVDRFSSYMAEPIFKEFALFLRHRVDTSRSIKLEYLFHGVDVTCRSRETLLIATKFLNALAIATACARAFSEKSDEFGIEVAVKYEHRGAVRRVVR